MYVCMYACMYICLYVCMDGCINECIDVCVYLPMKETSQRQSKATTVNVCQNEKKSNTKKFNITKANEYQSEKDPIQRFKSAYGINIIFIYMYIPT